MIFDIIQFGFETQTNILLKQMDLAKSNLHKTTRVRRSTLFPFC